MKITITAVSVPALRQIQAFRKRYEQQYPEDDLTIVCFYVAGQEQRYVLEPERIIKDIATADVAVVDTMGASEELQEIVAKGLKACKSHRIVIGNALRDYPPGFFFHGCHGKNDERFRREKRFRECVRDVRHRWRRGIRQR